VAGRREMGRLAAAAFVSTIIAAFAVPSVAQDAPVNPAASVPVPQFAQPTDLDRVPWGASRAGQYLAARHAELNLDYAKATEFYENALGQDPTNELLRRHVFQLLVSEGKIAAAEQHARAIYRHESGSFLPVMALYVRAMQQERYEEAIALLADLGKEDHIRMMHALGQAWAAAGARYLAAAQDALSFPLQASGWQSLRLIHTALVEDVAGGDADAAYAALEQSNEGKSPRIRALVENYRARQNDQTIQPIIKTAAEGMAHAFSTIAGALSQNNQPEMSMIYARLGMALAPNDETLLLIIADALQREGRFVDAADMYSRISKTSTFYYAAQLATARNLSRADKIDEAVAILRPLSEEDQTRAEAPALLGDLLRGEKRFQEAATAYDQAIARMSDEAQPDWRLHYTRGIARERIGNWEGAESDLTAALALEMDQPLVLNYLGYSWIDRGENLDKAKAMVRRAADLRPDDGFIADSVGWAAYRTGDFAEAVRELERAVALEPVDPIINEHLGDAYWRVGREVEARYQWQRALAFEPEEERVPGLKGRLQCGLGDCIRQSEHRTNGAH
jgi:Flp pilus assembly protein TadD